MKFTYIFTNDGNPPPHEKTRLVIEVDAEYGAAWQVLDAARLAFEEIPPPPDPILESIKRATSS